MGAKSPGQSEEQEIFVPGFRRIHWITLAVFDGMFSLWTYLSITTSDWSGWDTHPYLGILATITGPFSETVLHPWGDHLEVAWKLLPINATFLLIGIISQKVKIPHQRYPRTTAILNLDDWAPGMVYGKRHLTRNGQLGAVAHLYTTLNFQPPGSGLNRARIGRQ